MRRNQRRFQNNTTTNYKQEWKHSKRKENGSEEFVFTLTPAAVTYNSIKTLLLVSLCVHLHTFKGQTCTHTQRWLQHMGNHHTHIVISTYLRFVFYLLRFSSTAVSFQPPISLLFLHLLGALASWQICPFNLSLLFLYFLQPSAAETQIKVSSVPLPQIQNQLPSFSTLVVTSHWFFSSLM